MMTGEPQSIAVLLLTDADGAVYAVPHTVVTQWRLPAAAEATMREQQEVAGYSLTLGGYQFLGTALVGLPNPASQGAAALPRAGWPAGASATGQGAAHPANGGAGSPAGQGTSQYH
jgi:hypothetical protein